VDTVPGSKATPDGYPLATPLATAIDSSLDLSLRLASIRNAGTFDTFFGRDRYTVPDVQALARNKHAGSPHPAYQGDHATSYMTLTLGEIGAALPAAPAAPAADLTGYAVPYTGYSSKKKSKKQPYFWHGTETVVTNKDQVLLRYPSLLGDAAGTASADAALFEPVDVESKPLTPMTVDHIITVPTGPTRPHFSGMAGFYYYNSQYNYHKGLPNAGYPSIVVMSEDMLSADEYRLRGGSPHATPALVLTKPTLYLEGLNFAPGPEGGRLVVILDETYHATIMSHRVHLTLPNLSTGHHNLTAQIYTDDSQKKPVFVSEVIRIYYDDIVGDLITVNSILEGYMDSGNSGGSHDDRPHGDGNFASDDAANVASDPRTIAPELTILSPRRNEFVTHLDATVDFIFDYKCSENLNGVMVPSRCNTTTPMRYHADLYMNDVLLVGEKAISPGVYSSIPIPGVRNLGTGVQQLSLIVTTDTPTALLSADLKPSSSSKHSSSALPLAGKSTSFHYMDISRDIALSESAATNRVNPAQSPDFIYRLDAVQRSLNSNNKHGFVKRGMSIFSPENGSVLSERYTNGGGGLMVFYDIPWLDNLDDEYTGDDPQSYYFVPHIRVPRDASIEMIVSIPENSTCVDKLYTKKSTSKKKAPSLKGAARSVFKNKCGGYYGEVTIPLASKRGRVNLRGLGNGLHHVRFRLIDKAGNPIYLKSSLLKGDATPAAKIDTIASVSFTFNNYTLQNIRDDMPWENTDLTTELWNVVQSGTVEDLELLQSRNPSAIHSRSKDGRGILWWSYEYGRDDIISYLIEEGIDENAKDKEGFVARQLRELYIQK
jgi:hypothetical protein